jgi:hypothetical protein
MTWAIIATCFASSVAITKYDVAHRTRNAMLAGVIGALGAVVDAAVLGDPLRAVVFAPICFALGTGATFAGYALTQRGRR